MGMQIVKFLLGENYAVAVIVSGTALLFIKIEIIWLITWAVINGLKQNM